MCELERPAIAVAAAGFDFPKDTAIEIDKSQEAEAHLSTLVISFVKSTLDALGLFVD
jgi:hypothetical protein